MRWDLDHNTLFEFNGWVLSQNTKGVPIRGFLSAQLMCLWALVEEIGLDNPGPAFKEVLSKWDARQDPLG